MKIELDLTPQQEKFLKTFASKHYSGSKENLCTNMPIHVVESEDRVYFEGDSDYGDNTCFFLDHESPAYDNEVEVVKAYYEMREEECPIDIMPYNVVWMGRGDMIDVHGSKVRIYDYDDYFKAYGIEKPVQCCSYVTKYRPEAFFFIREEAQKYLSYQSHNITNPRIYTYSPGYGNHGDFEHFWALLFKAGELLLEKEVQDGKIES